MRWLWRILVVCIILGGIQWMHTHPDAPQTKQALLYCHEIHVHWDNFLGDIDYYWREFPIYMRNLLDTSPKKH